MIQDEIFWSEKLTEEKLGNLLSLISDIFFEYDVIKDNIKFVGNDVDKEIIKEFKGYVITTKSIHEDDKESILDLLTIRTAGNLEYRQIDKKGNISWHLVRAKAILNENNELTTIIGCIYHIDKQGKNNIKDVSKVYYDSLTKLYNKNTLESKIDEYLKEDGHEKEHAMLILDIDNLKAINHNLGRLFGDTVLKNIADKFKKLFFVNGFVGRIGGDEFLIFIKDVVKKEDLQKKVNLIKKVCEETYIGENLVDQISCSIGIGRYPKDGGNCSELFKSADKALHEVKNKGKNGYVFYNNKNSETLTDLDYYNYYQVKEDRKFGYSIFDKEITTFAFDIMASTKDTSSAINMLLQQLGKYFCASHVSILENAEDEKTPRLTYLWSDKNDKATYYKKSNLKQYDMDYNSYFNERGYFSVTDCSMLDENNYPYYSVISSIGIKSILQCGIFDQGVFRGCISINDCDEYRVWSKSEIDSLLTITKIISSYLLKIRTSQRSNERMEKIRNYDELTGLSTFYKFKRDSEDIIHQSKGKQKYAIIVSDISNFRFINDTLSYKAGDQVLCDFAKLLVENCRQNEIAARISADNFMTLFLFKDEESLIKRVECLNERFRNEQKLKNRNLNIYIISGICVINKNIDISTGIDNANIARKSIKLSQRSRCKLYDNQMFEKISKEIEIANSMDEALKNCEFSIYLQPKINLSDERLVGAEALVRWIKPSGNIISPDNFIPQFEKNGFIVNLDFFVYEEVCKTLRKWIESGVSVIPISVNVSRVHLSDKKFVDKFRRLVDSYNIPPKLLELELTETIFLEHTELALNTMRKFRKLGYQVSIDDFGAGYSSLNLLKDIQTDVLKIDKEFFGQGEMKKEEKVIVSNIINMAKELNMKVLSEGVETKMQSDFLRDISCDMAQGYFYSKPVPVEDFEQIMVQKQF